MITLTDGKIYLLRGGHIVQYKAGVSNGYGPDQVIREVTPADARFLRVRWAQLKVRRLHDEAAWTQRVMALGPGVQPSRIPKHITDRWEKAA